MIDKFFLNLLNVVPDFFKWRYKDLKKHEYFVTYLIFHCLIFCVYFFVFIFSFDDPVSSFLIKRWYSLIFFIIFFIFYLYVLLSKPKMDYLFNLEDTFRTYGKSMHIPGNLNFNEIKNLVKRIEINDCLNEIDLTFRDQNKRTLLIMGEPASGKTSLALSIGYDFWNKGFKKQVFYWNLNNDKGRKNIKESFSCLVNDIQRNHREIILIVEDIHNNIDTFEKSILPLISSNKNLAIVFTSRNIGKYESIIELDKHSTLNRSRMVFRRRDFVNLGKDKIFEIKSDYKLVKDILNASGLSTDNIDISLIKNQSGDNFNLVILDLLITVTLDAIKTGALVKTTKINRSEIYRFIEDRIEAIWKSLNRNICSKFDYLKIMFVLSVFSKYEFPIEFSYLKNYIKDCMSEDSLLNELVDQCELYQVRLQNNYGYIISHSKYAEIVNETLKNVFNLNLNEESILFDYCERGDRIFYLLNILMNDFRSYTYMGRRPNMNVAKDFSEFSVLIKKDLNKSQRINLGKFNLNEINRLLEETRYQSSELIKYIIHNNLNKFKELDFENYNLKTITDFLGFSEYCSEEDKIEIINSHKKYFLGNIIIDAISNNNYMIIGTLIKTLASHSEEACFSFVAKNEETLKNMCSNFDSRTMAVFLRISLTNSDKINNLLIGKIYSDKIEGIFKSDILQVLRFLDWDFWTIEKDAFLKSIEKYLKNENLRKIISEAELNNIGYFFAHLIWLGSSLELLIDVLNHFKNEIIEIIISSDTDTFNKFYDLINMCNKDFAQFVRNLLNNSHSVPKSQ